MYLRLGLKRDLNNHTNCDQILHDTKETQITWAILFTFILQLYTRFYSYFS